MVILYSSSFRKLIKNIQTVQDDGFGFYLNPSKLIKISIMIGILFSFSVAIDKMLKSDFEVHAQTEQEQQHQSEAENSSSEQVSIKLDSVKFTSLDDSGNNQLKVDITYKTNDPKLVNTIMHGVMKVYTIDGILIKTSSIPSGYILGQAGPMHFATTIEDKSIHHVKAEIAMTDSSKLVKISNTIEVDATFEN